MAQVRRSPFFGGILGLLFPGLGFMYGGNIKLSIYYNLAFIYLTFFIGRIFVKEYPLGIYLNFALIMAWYIFSFFGAFIYVLKNRDITKRSYNRFEFYILFVLCILSVQYAFSKHRDVLFGYEAYRIRGYVGDTLLPYDLVITNTKPTDLNVGDILVYKGTRGRSVAKVVEKLDNGFLLNNLYDNQSIISKNSIYGKVKYIWFSWNADDSSVRWERFPRYIQ